MTNLPLPLVDAVKERNALLFLGAGASTGAYHPKGNRVPTGKELANLIIDKYLGEEYKGISLIRAAELAIAETDLFTFQDFIASVFSDYYPGKHHGLIPKFYWKSIFTTNYDLIIERAYDQAIKAKENLQVVIR
jgi:hypothetical protein